MNCNWSLIASLPNGQSRLKCQACGREHATRREPDRVRFPCRVQGPAIAAEQARVKPKPCDPSKYTIRRPGDMLAWLICKTTGVAPCSTCNSRRERMNRWGWTGCLWKRHTIYAWLQAEAKKRGVTVERAAFWSLLRAAVREALKATA